MRGRFRSLRVFGRQAFQVGIGCVDHRGLSRARHREIAGILREGEMERREELLAIESAARAGLLDDSDEITEGIGVYLRIPDLTSLSREFTELLLLRIDAVQRVRDVLAGLDLDGELHQQLSTNRKSTSLN